jgi:hypothetical protein
MKAALIVLGGLASALWATAAAADPLDQVLSTQEFTVDLSVTRDNLTCNFTPGRAGTYIPRDSSWVSLALPGDDYHTVFNHAYVMLNVVGDEAQALCGTVDQILAAAAGDGGRLRVSQKLVLSIIKFPNTYGNNCQRYLSEVLTVNLPNGVVLSSEQDRTLEALPLRDCR